jgi:hypothetical protein
MSSDEETTFLGLRRGPQNPPMDPQLLEQVAALTNQQQNASARSEALENQVRILAENLQALLGRFAAPPVAPDPPPAILPTPLDANMLRMLEKATYGSHPKLMSTYDNSPEWQTRFVQAATTYGLLGVFVTDPAGQTYPDAVHRASMNLLCDSIDTNVMMALKTAVITRGEAWEAARPRELYTHLQHQWSSKMNDRTFELKTLLIQFELYSGESIASYFDRLQDLWVKLTACGSPPGMESLLDAAVRGLNRHAAYDSVCMQIKSGLEWPTMNVSKARSMLSQHETKLAARATQGPPRPNPVSATPTPAVFSPLVDTPTPTPPSLDPLLMESIYAFMQSKGSVGKVGRDTTGMTCYYCEKKGHIASECRTKARDKAKGTLKPRKEN